VSSLRRVVRDQLGRAAFDEVVALAGEPSLVRTLVSLLYDPDELLRWRAVSAIGALAGVKPEQVRPLVTRLLWTLNDESGGIGWTSAPALGEIGRNAPALLASCVRVVVHYLEDRGLLPGVLWAIGRLAPAFPHETREVVPELLPLLDDGSPAVRGHAAWALGEIGDPGARGACARLAADEGEARIYTGGGLVTRRVREWALEAASRLGGPAPEVSPTPAG
jgi:HEAT repeat protein